jgi:16S rRNA processing protein RimM
VLPVRVTGPIRTSTSSTTEPIRPESGADEPLDPAPAPRGAVPPPEPPPSAAPPGTAPDLLEIGTIAKPHGLAGEVVVNLVTNRTERLAEGSTFSTASGRVLTVTSSRPFQKRWIVAFEDVSDRTTAERLRGTALLAEPVSLPDALWVHELVGSSVEDAHGTPLGTVTSVVANPASDLLELDNGALVPLVFVVDQGPGRVVVDIPDGLIE